MLGTVLSFPYLGERIGVPAKVGYKALDYDAVLDARGVPVVALAGTCMEAGKTAAAAAIIARMRHRGLVVDTFKATGVSLRRDIMAFEDSGARRTMLFTDLGIVTTTAKCGPVRYPDHADGNGYRDRLTPSCSNWAMACWGPMGWNPFCASPTSRSALTAGGSVGERSGRCVGRRQAVARALRHRTLRRDRSLDRQSGGHRDHPRANARRRLQCHQPPGGLGDHIIASLGLRNVREFPRSGRMTAPTPAIVLGAPAMWPGNWYFIAGHPQLEVAAVLSDSQPGAPVADAFAHLRGAYPELKFAAADELQAVICRAPVSALFSAAPHGVSAAIVDRLLTAANRGRHA